jgi:hypothetical protein
MWRKSGAVFYSKQKIRKDYYSIKEIDRLNQYLYPLSWRIKNSRELFKCMQNCLRGDYRNKGISVLGSQEISEMYEIIFATKFEDLPTVETHTKRGNLSVMWRYEIAK